MEADQPIVRLGSLDRAGVSLLGSDDPEFLNALESRRARTGDALLPYTLLLKNDPIARSLRFRSAGALSMRKER
jgi:hypothetical protein